MYASVPFERRGVELALLAAELRGDVEVDELADAGLRVIDDVVRVDVLVNDVRGMDVADDGRELCREAQPLPRAAHAAARDPRLERHAAEVLEDEGELATVLHEGVGADDAVESSGRSRSYSLRKRVSWRAEAEWPLETLDDHARAVARPPGAVDRQPRCYRGSAVRAGSPEAPMPPPVVPLARWSSRSSAARKRVHSSAPVVVQTFGTAWNTLSKQAAANWVTVPGSPRLPRATTTREREQLVAKRERPHAASQLGALARNS